MDIDDLLGPGRPSQAKATSRTTGRFQPNAGKLKAKPKTEPLPEPLIKKQEDSPLPPNTSTLHNTTHKVEEKPSMEAEMAIVPNLDADRAANEQENQEEEEEDTVVDEIDVFFNPSPFEGNAQLYIMQYPLRACWRPYELNERCQEVRIKPQQSKLEVDLEINFGKGNFDEAVAGPLGFEKQTLSSSRAPFVTGYAVGFLAENKLHLNPVHAVVKLRPSLGYLNVLQKKNNVAGSEVVASSDMGKLVEATSETVDDAQPWISLEYHGTDSPFSNKHRQNLVAKESSHIQFALSSSDYANSLCLGRPSNINGAEGPLRRFFLTLPLEERIKKWFSEGPPVHRFYALMHLAPDHTEGEVLKVLQQYAVLVRGLWVAKSSLRCANVQALARDYILLLFSASRFIQFGQLRKVKISNEILVHALTPLAVERSAFGYWKFKEPEDNAFIEDYPEIVKEQRLAWLNRKQGIMDLVHGYGKRNTSTVARNSVRISDQDDQGRISSDSADLGARGGQDVVQSVGTTTMSAETRDALPKALVELFNNHKVCSLQLICQGLRDMAVSKSTLPKADARARIARAAAVGVASQPELQAIISQIAVNIHGVYVLKPLGNSNIDPLRSVVIDLFCGKERNAKLKKADFIEATKIKLDREFSNSEYMQVLNELCVSSKGGGWMLKSGDGKPR
ncbi:hypothetical protein AAC387_Pa07g2076 [Persea americana]